MSLLKHPLKSQQLSLKKKRKRKKTRKTMRTKHFWRMLLDITSLELSLRLL